MRVWRPSALVAVVPPMTKSRLGFTGPTANSMTTLWRWRCSAAWASEVSLLPPLRSRMATAMAATTAVAPTRARIRERMALTYPKSRKSVLLAQFLHMRAQRDRRERADLRRGVRPRRVEQAVLVRDPGAQALQQLALGGGAGGEVLVELRVGVGDGVAVTGVDVLEPGRPKPPQAVEVLAQAPADEHAALAQH